ncbi:DUF1488 family protein [Burkholderia seminalis]|uniref:DUF1488 family protein n=2 Tax=Burkholderia cepacia complex TaxID=87882 RepID=A0A8A8CZP8_9BURK|nr:DUF1488 family protein [Burkholderia seminalis]QTO17924.1 DUF1488 family protein [Burkholderia seminalis]
MAYEQTPGTLPIEISHDVRFTLTIDGVEQRFVISREALEDHFGYETGRIGGAVAAFERGKARIFEVAVRKPDIGETDSIVISSFDF